MSTKEIYRSFSGKLNLENKSGYIITSIGDGQWIECESLSVDQDVLPCKIRFRPVDAPSDWSNESAIGEIIDAVDCGRIPGQVFWHGKWQSPQSIIESHCDYNWRRHCK